jgi:hypothetical protein
MIKSRWERSINAAKTGRGPKQGISVRGELAWWSLMQPASSLYAARASFDSATAWQASPRADFSG